MKRAELHYLTKLKRTVLTHIAYFPLNQKLAIMYKYVMQRYILYLFLNYNILSLYYGFVKSRRDYIIISYMQTKNNSHYLHKTFVILRKNAIWKQKARESLYKAVEFSKKKYYPVFLKNYFAFWRTYAKEAIKQREQMLVAENFYKNKIRSFYLKKLLKFTRKQQIKKFKLNLAVKAHETKLKTVALRTLIRFVQYKQSKFDKKQTAIMHYNRHLQVKYFSIILNFTKDEQRVRFVQEKLAYNQKYRCFTQLQLYALYKQRKTKKLIGAINHHEHRLKIIAMSSFKRILIESQSKQEKICNFLNDNNQKRLGRCFNNLADYKQRQKEKRDKTQMADRHFNNKLLNKYWNLWRKFSLKCLTINGQLERLLLNWTFRDWKTFVSNRISFRKKIAEARTFYEASMAKNALKVIIRAGLAQEIVKERAALNCMERRFKNVAKYFRIWKNKCSKRKGFSNLDTHRGETLNNFLKNERTIERFRWNHLCYAEPKVPQYLRNIYE